MAGTCFQAPLKQGGPDTGLTSTNTQVNVPFIKSVQVSAGGRDVTFTLPDASYLHNSTGFVTVACSSLSQGGRILIGDGTTDNLYGAIGAVQAVGAYAVTMTEAAVSAKTVVVKVTASVAASAAQFTAGDITVNIVGGIRG
jgi:hypothetical protein